jgi:putative ABC transport system ATP-binding protein
MGAEQAVTCRGLGKSFRDGDQEISVLRSVDLEVELSQMTLIVGPSGCGKTTLVSLIAGLLTPSTGAIRVLGRELSSMSNDERVTFRGQSVGFVFQQYNLLSSLNAVENAAVPLLIQGVSRARACERSRALLTELGLGKRLEARPAQLSGGEQQRVAMARALVHDPRLLVCDEPTAALDAQSGQRVMELLRKVAVKPGRAVIVVTHDPRVLSFGDRIVHMADGGVTQIERRQPAQATEWSVS